MVRMTGFDPSKPFQSLPVLPPPTQKIETIEVLRQESRATAALGELKGIAKIIPNQSILINAVVLQEAQDSSEIENIITTRDELYKALSHTGKTDPSTKEVTYYREALFEGFRRTQQRGILTINDIVAIQEILVQNSAGIRTQPGTALVNDKTGEVIYTPPSGVDTLTSLLGNFVSFLHDETTSLAKLAVLHYQFESIHPFYDGNGRTGRIINVLYLVIKGYLDIPILYLSSYIIKNRSVYYRLLLEVTKSGNWTEWILFILKGIEITSRETIKKIEQIKQEMDRTVEYVRENAPKIYSKELVETLFVHPYCKVEFIVASLGVERKAASRYLHQLVEIGVLEVQKVGKENIFINRVLMGILKKANIDFNLTTGTSSVAG